MIMNPRLNIEKADGYMEQIYRDNVIEIIPPAGRSKYTHIHYRSMTHFGKIFTRVIRVSEETSVVNLYEWWLAK